MLKMVNNLEEANVVTHSGSFHADDVFATIFLNKIYPEVRLIRVTDIKEDMDLKEKIVFDIGYTEFDHHGPNARVRENKIKYSAFGLLFEQFGKDYLKSLDIKEIDTAYEHILKEFILQIDAFDNGIFPKSPEFYSVTSISSLIEMFNPTWKEDKSSNECFLEAVTFGTTIFDRSIKKITDKLAAKELVEEAILKSENHILYLEQYLPFMDFVLKSENELAKEIIFAIFPSNREGYNVRAINKELNNHENRLNFPESWGGKSKEELIDLTGIETFRFCHSNLFLCSVNTLEDAFLVAKLALEQKKETLF